VPTTLPNECQPSCPGSLTLPSCGRSRCQTRRSVTLGLQKAVQRRATFVTQRDEWAKRECAISAVLRRMTGLGVSA